jgi:hypothetical protein
MLGGAGRGGLVGETLPCRSAISSSSVNLPRRAAAPDRTVFPVKAADCGFSLPWPLPLGGLATPADTARGGPPQPHRRRSTRLSDSPLVIVSSPRFSGLPHLPDQVGSHRQRDVLAVLMSTISVVRRGAHATAHREAPPAKVSRSALAMSTNSFNCSSGPSAHRARSSFTFRPCIRG